MTFVPLQVMSAYTLLESTIDIDGYVQTAKSLGYKALTLTDTDNLYGAVKFYRACQSQDIQPIIGLRVQYFEEDDAYPLVILSKNNQGYQQLLELTTQIQRDGVQLHLADLAQWVSNWQIIIPLTSSQWWKCDDKRKRLEILDLYRKNLGDFYLGISPSDLRSLTYLENIMDYLEQESLSAVALPEIRMLSRDDQTALNVLKLIGSSKNPDEITRDDIYGGDGSAHVLLDPDEYMTIYERAGVLKLAQETEKIAQSCTWDLTLGRQNLPKFPDTAGLDSQAYLRKLCEKSLAEKVPQYTKEYEERLDREIAVICEMGFADYFLIVWDICQFSKREGILMGAGRGSAAGSLVAYILGITQIDPIAYDLLFERFLNSERETMPDIDLDFPDNQRDKIFDYLSRKYSADHVAHIATFGTFAARASLRDVGRIFGLDSQELKSWSQAVPDKLDITLQQAYQQSESLRKKVGAAPQNKDIFEIALTIEGLPRHISTHAAGIVLSEAPLTHSVPLQKGSDYLPLTQFTMEDVESVGLLKLDILALRNLTIISDTLKMIPYETGRQRESFSLADIPLDDPQTMALFQRGETVGIFQFESDGIRRVLKRVEPTHFEDLVAVNALYRPGPAEQIGHFIDRKQGKEPIAYPHEDLRDILQVTYGIMIYQEQVMQVASKLAGYSLNEADLLRRAISKKDSQGMKEERYHFISGAVKKGYSADLGREVFDLIAKFAGYGFNRSHAVAYSMIAYQMAYLKVHYPTSFYTALLRSTRSKDKRNRLLMEVRQRGIKVKPPHINYSWQTYIVKNRAIYFGLRQIKGVRRDFVQAIIDERNGHGLFEDFIDFVERMDAKYISEKNLTPLIYAGSFDALEESRRSIIESLPTIITNYEMSGANADLLSLFTLEVVPHDEYSDQTKREQEFSYLNYAFTPVFGKDLNAIYEQYEVSYIAELVTGKQGKVIGKVNEIKKIKTKKGDFMSFIDVSDETGKMSWTLFPELHHRYIRDLEKNKSYLAQGKIEKDRFGLKMLIQTLKPLSEILAEYERQEQEKDSRLFLRTEDLTEDQGQLKKIQTLLKAYSGAIPVVLYDKTTKRIYHFSKDYSVSQDQKLVDQLKNLLGEKNVVLENKEK